MAVTPMAWSLSQSDQTFILEAVCDCKNSTRGQKNVYNDDILEARKQKAAWN